MFLIVKVCVSFLMVIVFDVDCVDVGRVSGSIIVLFKLSVVVVIRCFDRYFMWLFFCFNRIVVFIS